MLPAPFTSRSCGARATPSHQCVAMTRAANPSRTCRTTPASAELQYSRRRQRAALQRIRHPQPERGAARAQQDGQPRPPGRGAAAVRPDRPAGGRCRQPALRAFSTRPVIWPRPRACRSGAISPIAPWRKLAHSANGLISRLEPHSRHRLSPAQPHSRPWRAAGAVRRRRERAGGDGCPSVPQRAGARPPARPSSPNCCRTFRMRC